MSAGFVHYVRVARFRNQKFTIGGNVSLVPEAGAQSVKLFYDVPVVSLDILSRQLIHPLFYLFARHGHCISHRPCLAGVQDQKRGPVPESARIFQGPSMIDITSTLQILAISFRAASAFVNPG
jgi:hypothetical protein